jgi:hypothetical protein
MVNHKASRQLRIRIANNKGEQKVVLVKIYLIAFSEFESLNLILNTPL